MKINPFDPNNPCKPEIFAGREEELDIVNNLFIRAAASNICGFTLTGNRGIGKTSFRNYIKSLAKGEIKAIENNSNFLVLEVILGPKTSQIQLIKKIKLALKRQLRKYEKARESLDKAWEFLGRLEILGNKVDTSRLDEDELVFEEFCYSFSDTISRITKSDDNSWVDSNFDGVLLIIDECDLANEDLDLGVFVKLLFERLNDEKTTNFVLAMVGLPSTRKVLYESHPSSLRILESIVLDRFSYQEVKEIVQTILAHGNAINSEDMTIDDEALEEFYNFSKGFPHFVHQIGKCAYDLSTRDSITASDILLGTYADNGAIVKLGAKFFQLDRYKNIKDQYAREILQFMSKNFEGWFTKEQLEAEIQGDNYALDQGLSILIKNNFIIENETANDEYRPLDKSFAWWLNLNKMLAEERQNRERKLNEILSSEIFPKE